MSNSNQTKLIKDKGFGVVLSKNGANQLGVLPKKSATKASVVTNLQHKSVEIRVGSDEPKSNEISSNSEKNSLSLLCNYSASSDDSD